MLEGTNTQADPYATHLLMKELRRFQTEYGSQSTENHPGLPEIDVNLVEDNLFEWEITLIFLSEFDMYHGAVLKARMSFPSNFPMMPPKMTFLTKMFHPNIYSTGEVCISILHPPEKDEFGYESIDERWRPTMSVETILLSVISMLADPNADSPANPEAATLFRDDRKKYNRTVRRLVEESV